MDAHLSKYIGCSPEAVITAEIKTYSSNVNRQRMAQFNYVTLNSITVKENSKTIALP